ncbi:hypothetical protein FJ420_19880 [Mesorhizobium sp. B3-1-3]|uniref:hypothetical protein n=1 Tax=unclassified Mesorhizobium TaxID=325217 RepID=UPI00112BFD21|nr:MULTISPECIES: hypothetical protein [unclassified Mesorhizobium]TPI54843.1 hypothetical protein FJ424_31265 [Mesorhizobium sp. B3-1-8]TPI55968.1 hypothetical protein FJ417_22820 [Mesorhizobium sp. B3-1-7]TPI68734.1 hypothetical protein FJ420_19880 [Mesorhizobium sp. B3-1-3]
MAGLAGLPIIKKQFVCHSAFGGCGKMGHGKALILLSRLTCALGSLNRYFCINNWQIMIFL